jgi:hypothetical protein
MSGQPNQNDTKLQQFGQVLLNAAHQLMRASGAGAATGPSASMSAAGAGTVSFVPMSAGGAGMGSYMPMSAGAVGMNAIAPVTSTGGAGMGSFMPMSAGAVGMNAIAPVTSTYFPARNPAGSHYSMGQVYPGPAGGYGSSMNSAGGYGGFFQNTSVTREEVNNVARFGTMLTSELAAEVKEVTQWAKDHGFKPSRTFASIDKLDPEINNIESHQMKNSITNATPAYVIKTTEGQRAFDESMQLWSKKRTLTMLQLENIAYASAKDADEEVEKSLYKKPRPALAEPTTPGKAECMKVFQELTNDQKATLVESEDTLKTAKKFKATSGNKIKVAEKAVFTENLTIYGLHYFLTKKGINPFKKPDAATMTEFHEFKDNYGFPIEDDWDGSEDSCLFPDA